MSNSYIKKEYIQVVDSVQSWQDSIRLAAQPLLIDGCITEEYIDKMIQTVYDLGDYIVVVPMIALPHARSEGTVLQNSLSLLKLKKPILFGEKEDSQATVIMPLACIGNDDHLQMLSRVAEIFVDEDNMDFLRKSDDQDAIYELLSELNL